MPPSSVATKVEKDAAGKILVVIRELHICAAIQPHERGCSPERKEVSDGGRSVQVKVGLGESWASMTPKVMGVKSIAL